MAAQGRPPSFLEDVIDHHFRQQIAIALPRCTKGKTTVFYLGIQNVEVEAGVVTSRGQGMFAGPLKSSTAAEKDMLVASLGDMPPSFRARLDQIDALLTLVARVAISSGRTYSFVLGFEESHLKDMMVGKTGGSVGPDATQGPKKKSGDLKDTADGGLAQAPKKPSKKERAAARQRMEELLGPKLEGPAPEHLAAKDPPSKQ